MSWKITALIAALLLIACGGNEPKKEGDKQKPYPRVRIETELGKIVLELWPDVAPNHVANFLDLVDKGFYRGLTWHRVIKDFIIQSGSPNNDISGHAGYVIEAEFSNLPHNPGTLSMARGVDPNSASCQFFICLDRRPDLDGRYTIFGQTVEGLDVVQAIGRVETDADDRPLKAVHIVNIGREDKRLPAVRNDSAGE